MTVMVLFVLLLFSFPWHLSAQILNTATCTTALWTFNEAQQSPCLVYATIMGQCYGGSFSMYGPPYHGVSLGGSNDCWCSSVSYTTLSACSYCQSDTPMTWPHYTMNCTTLDISIATWPHTIPSGISVPAWAYEDPTQTSNQWDPNVAQAIAAQHLPDISAGTAPTTLSDLLHSTSSATRTSPTESSTLSSSAATTSTSSKNNNTVAVAVGVAVPLGVISLILISFLTAYTLRKRRRAAAAASLTTPGPQSGPMAAYPTSITPSSASPLTAEFRPNTYYPGPASSPGASVSPDSTMRGSTEPYQNQAPYFQQYDPDNPATYPAASLGSDGGHNLPTASGPTEFAYPQGNR